MFGCSECRASCLVMLSRHREELRAARGTWQGKGPQGLNSVLCVRRPVSCLPRPPLLRLLSRVLARACLGGHAQHSAVIRMALPPLSGDGTLALWRAHCETGIGVMPPIPYLNLFFCGTCWGSIHSIAQDGCEPCLACALRAHVCVYTHAPGHGGRHIGGRRAGGDGGGVQGGVLAARSASVKNLWRWRAAVRPGLAVGTVASAGSDNGFNYFLTKQLFSRTQWRAEVVPSASCGCRTRAIDLL